MNTTGSSGNKDVEVNELEEYRNIVTDVQSYMKESDKSQKQIAREIAVSAAALSQFLDGTYNGDNSNIADKLKSWLSLEAKRNTKEEHSRFSTDIENTKTVLYVCEYAHTKNDITLIFGDAGAGKTTALEYYRDRNAGVIMITANACTTSATSILKMLCMETGRNITGRKDIIMNELVKYFKGTNRLIIIDEADHLTLSALQAIRNLNDMAKVGIVLSGNNKIFLQMIGGAKSSEFQQLRTRITVRRKLSNKYKKSELKQIFPSLPNDCITFVSLLAEKESLRTAKKIVELAYDCAGSYNREISLELLEHTKNDVLQGIF